ncbi:hypothetical protein Btru_025291 [Bulinus truncatus]|nr:hypothetical protein Btru_025291 [Bulinus truncatus]
MCPHKNVKVPPNNQIDYYITSGGVYFDVIPATGDVIVKAPLYTDTTNASSYQVTFVARDRGTPSLQSDPFTLTVNVRRNYYSPQWIGTPYSFTLNAPVTDNQLIQTLTAKDDDALYARVQDNGIPRKYDIAFVSLYFNRNFKTPSFPVTTKSVNITENTPPGDLISNCAATDSDSGTNGQIVYTSVSSLPASNYFQVLQNSGGIILLRDLHQDRFSSYVVLLTAQDQGTPPLSAPTTCTVTVNVYRDLYAPVFVNTPYDTTLNNNAVIGTTVVRVTATDADTTNPFGNVYYEIVRQSVDGAFTVDRNTRIVTVNSTLTQSTYTIAVRAYDGGNPPLSAYNVFVVTINGNNQSPQFQSPGSSDSYQKTVEVLETINVLYNITNVVATDGDNGAAGRVSYYLVGNSQAIIYFLVNPDNGYVSLRTSLLQDTANQYILYIIARDNDPQPRQSTSTATVTVNVYRNLYPPVSTLNCTRLVDETLSVGQTVTAVSATDTDRKNTYETVRYEIIGDVPGFFQVDSVTGSVTLRSSLSNSSATSLNLIVRAYDNGVPAKSAIITCTVNVNKNFNTPVWSTANPNNPQFTYTINVDQALYVPFGQLSATDADSKACRDPEATVHYQIIGGAHLNGFKYFFLNSETGELILINNTNLVNINNFTITVRAYDLGTPSLSTTAIVTVVIQKDTDTLTVPNYTWTVAENVANASVVGTVQPSTSVGVTYSVVGFPPATDLFGLNAASGQVVIIRNLSGDCITQYTLIVRASRNTGLTVKTADFTVTINVLRNLNAPIFSLNNYETTIPDITTIGTSILNVSATDADGDVITYYATGESDTLNLFTLLNTGSIIIINNLRGLPKDTYTMNVNAMDNGHPQRQTPVNVTITIIHFPCGDTVGENGVLGPVYHRMNITEDRNLLCKTSYDMQTNLSIFSITPEGYLQLSNGTLDYETINMYNVIVTVSVSTPLVYSSSIEVIIIVINLNDNNPEIMNSNRIVTLAEGNYDSYEFTVIKATDKDYGPPLFMISKVHPYQSKVHFNITEDGKVRITGLILNHEAYNIYIRAFDNGTPVRSCEVIVFVIATASLKKENTLSEGGVYFDVIPTTGDVIVKAQLYTDTTNASSYQVTFVARDRGTPSLQSDNFTLTVNVRRNYYSPQWIGTPYSFTLNAPVSDNQLIQTLTAKDDDASPFNQLSFDIISYPGFSSLFNFVNPGLTSVELRVSNANSILTDSRTVYYLYVRVQDNGIPRKYDIALVSIYFSRNFNTPSFPVKTKTVNITENTPPGDLISNCAATDSDSGTNGQIVYTSVSSLPASNYFQVLQNSGGIILQRDLHQDRSSSYVVLLTAQDQGTPPLSAPTTCTVTVNVYRDLYAPVFVNTPYDTTLTNNAVIGTTVVRVTATDADTTIPFGNVYYEMVRQSVEGAFTVDRNTGIVTVNATLTQSTYTIAVRAYDGGNPPLSAYNVFVVLINGNNQSPQFQSPGSSDSYQKTVEVLETINVLYNITNIVATDGDNGAAGRVSYYLVGNSQAIMYFLVNPDNGYVSLRTSLLQDTANQYILYIIARDNDPQPRQSTTTATVTVNVYRNLYPPVSTLNCTRLVDENLAVGQTVTAVSATDADRTNTYERVRYEIIGDAPGFFQVDSVTGSVTLRSSLSNSSATSLNLIVRAYDNGVPAKSAIITCTFSVNKNFNTPVWSTANPNNPQFTYTINVDQALYVPIGPLSATDADSKACRRQGELILINNTNLVNINNFTITVRAYDLGTPSLSTTAIVTVVIQKDADTLTVPNYTWTVAENVANASVVGTVQASTRVGVTYSVVGFPPATDLFGLNAASGQVVIIRNLSGDCITQYTLIVRASRNTGLTVKTADFTVTINVLRNLNAPIFSLNNYETTIPDITTIGTSILNVSATDADGDVITYYATGESDTLNLFTLLNTGSIIITNNLRGLPKDTYTMNVNAMDNGHPQRQTPVNVTITIIHFPCGDTVGENGVLGPVYHRMNITEDRNLLKICAEDPVYTMAKTCTIQNRVTDSRFPPVFSPSSQCVTAPYVRNISSWSHYVNVTDADSNQITCSIIGNIKAQDYFTIEPYTCTVRMAKSLLDDPDKTAVYSIMVEASDGSVPKLTSIYSLDVIVNRDSGNNATQPHTNLTCTSFENSTSFCYPRITYNSIIGYIFENSPSGSLVFSDRTTAELLKFTIHVPDKLCKTSYDTQTNLSIFSITPEGYLQLSNGTLDYETINMYNVTVTVSVSTPLVYSSSLEVIIIVINLNDNNPEIMNSNRIVTLAEGNYDSYEFTAIKATDKDYGPPLFMISKVHPYQSKVHFNITEDGKVRITGLILNHEAYNIYIRAFDNGTPVRSCEVIVFVIATASLKNENTSSEGNILL